jgi:short-subunit dehydrogenase
MNRRALVTGAGSGIGAAIAIEFARNGFDLIIAGRTSGKLETVKRSAAACGVDVSIMRLDVTSEEDIRALSEEFGGAGLDVVVNSAAQIILNDIEHADIREFDVMMATNVRGPVLLLQALLPSISDGGSVVFINSLAGVRTSPFNILFSSTKHGLRAIANGLRSHLEPRRIRVLSVYPPLTATPTGEYVKSFYGSPYDPAVLLQPETVAEEVTRWVLDGSDSLTDMTFPER